MPATPRLSVCLIVGDAQLSVLARCLKSVVCHPAGPAADEVVIGWNGKEGGRFADVLEEVFGPLAGISDIPPATLSETPVRFTHAVDGVAIQVVIHSFEWKDDFSYARNLNFSHATGVWRAYMDGDDVLATADSVAYRDSLERDPKSDVPRDATDAYGVFPENVSLPEFVSKLPEHVNVVLAPYNYVNDPRTGRPLLRKRRPRIMRWDANWVWVSSVHEIPRHALGKEIPVWCPGVLFVHQPVQEVEERGKRNKPILEQQVRDLLAGGEKVPGPLLYALAGQELEGHCFLPAGDLFRQAVLTTSQWDERFFYSLMAGRCYAEAEDWTQASECAKNAIVYCPDRPEGYFFMSEVAFRSVHSDEHCIKWYEAGKDKKASGPILADDRFERCLKPVRYAGVAYLRAQRFAEALEVAEKAIREALDPFALKIKDAAEQGLRRGKLIASTLGLAEQLQQGGYPARALALLDLIEVVVGSPDDFLRTRFDIAKGVAAVPPDPKGKKLEAWLATRRPGDVGLQLPLDSVEEPSVVLEQVASGTPDGQSLLAFTTDSQVASSYASELRVDAVPAARLLSLLEKHGVVEDLSLLEEELEGGGPTPIRHVAARVVVRRPSAPWKADVTFFCPVFMEPWGPWRVLLDGTGGSEESVVYAARELAGRGLNVEVYAPLDDGRHRGVHVEGRVRWKPLGSFDPTKRLTSIAVAHRAPFAVRIHAFDPGRLFVWHQDADYRGDWSAPIAKAVGHFWVSRWQRARLLAAVGLAPGVTRNSHAALDWSGSVIGNGVPASAIDVPFPEKREPLTVAYTSSPMRGLAEFLPLWPEIHSAFPGARLRVYYGWHTTGSRIAAYRAYVMGLVAKLKASGVEWIGRVPQFELERELVQIGTWAYPCHAVLEGYCVAGVRAAAAGCAPVYMATGAMLETQYPSPFMCPPTPWGEGGCLQFKSALLAALEAESTGSRVVDRQAYRAWASQFTWSRAVGGMLAEWNRRGLLAGPVGMEAAA